MLYTLLGVGKYYFYEIMRRGVLHKYGICEQTY